MEEVNNIKVLRDGRTGREGGNAKEGPRRGRKGGGKRVCDV